MKILAIDTSGQQGSAAIIGAENTNAPYISCIGEIFFNARTGEKSWTHSEALMPGVEKLFELTRLEPSDMNYVAYTNGPGSFTGLRIGASCAIAIAHGLGVPAIAVPTLDALAQNVSCGDGEAVIPMLDARRGQVYTAVYLRKNGVISRITEFLAVTAEKFLQVGEVSVTNLTDCTKIFFLGDGAEANEKIIREKFPDAIFVPANNNRQRAASVGLCAFEKIRLGEEFCEKIELIYVRPPQAIREAQRRAAAI